MLNKTGIEIDDLEIYFHELLESTNELVQSVASDGSYLFVNKAWMSALGYSDDEIEGLKFTDLIRGDHLENCMAIFKDLSLGKSYKGVETIFVAKDGSELEVLGNLVPVMRDGKMLATIGLFRDITEEKKREKSLEEDKQKYESLYEKSSDAMMILTPGGIFIDGNLQTLAMFCCADHSEFKGSSTSDFSPEYQPDGRLSSDKAQEVIDIALKDGEHFFEWMHRRLDGNDFMASVRLTKMNIQGKDLLQATVRDITEQKRIEEELLLQRDIISDLMTKGSFPEICERMLSRIVGFEGVDCGGFYLVDEETGDLDMIAQKNLSPGFAESVKCFKSGSPQSLLIQKGKVVHRLFENLLQDKWDDVLDQEHLRAITIIPIKRAGRVIAAMNIASHTLDVLPNDLLLTLENISSYVGDAIAEMKINTELHRLKEMVLQAKSIMVLTDLKGDITYVNPEFCKQTGYSSDEVVGRNPKILKSGAVASVEYEKLWKTIIAGEVWQGEFCNKRKDGTLYWEEAVISPILTPEGELISFAKNSLDITESRRDREDLLEKKGQLEMIIEGANLGWWDWDILSGKEKYNEMLSRNLGYELSEIEPHIEWWKDKIHPDDSKCVADKLQEHFDGKTEFFINKHRLKTKAGEWKWFLDYGKVVSRDEVGKPLRMIGTLRDIDEQERSGKLLKESEKKLRNIVESSTNLFFSHTPEGKITYISPQSREFLQCEPEDAMVIWTELITDNPVNELGRALTKKAIETGKQQPFYELELGGKLGRVVWAEVREAPIVEDGRVVAIVGSLTDITERKRNDDLLKESEERLQQISKNSREWIWEIDVDGLYTYSNDAIEQILGYRAEEVVGKKHYYDFLRLGDRDAIVDLINRIFANKEPIRGVVNLNKHKNGSDVWLSTSGLPILNDVGELIGYRGVDVDITERKQAEDRVAAINRCFLELGTDYDKNVEIITRICGEVLGAFFVSYGSMDASLFCTQGIWNKPPTYDMKSDPKNCICSVLIDENKGDCMVIRELQKTQYRESVPVVAEYNLQTYAGHLVRSEGRQVGVLCALFQDDRAFSDDELDMLGAFSGVLGVEENRNVSRLALQDKLFDVARLNELMFGRERRVLELKEEVDRLMEKLGEESKYLT